MHRKSLLLLLAPLVALLPAVAAGERACETLREGDCSDEVRSLQTRLWYLGFYLEEIIGEYDVYTVTTVKLFQAAERLPTTGEANGETQRALYSLDAPRTNYAQPDPVGDILRMLIRVLDALSPREAS